MSVKQWRGKWRRSRCSKTQIEGAVSSRRVGILSFALRLPKDVLHERTAAPRARGGAGGESNACISEEGEERLRRAKRHVPRD
jgi:hypothetical protein